ncbi:MAG: acyltransferase family protein [Psychromonas sp.]
MQYRKDINGLRALAVIAVVVFHFNKSWMPGGFAGVDVFFVISGFLMTGIIFRGIEQKNFSILKFYIDRANRIIPALAVLCFVLLIFGWFYIKPLDYEILGKHIVSSLAFLSNIIYWKESGYFDATSLEKWLLHTWSLSVEWQFYIIYPLVLVVMRKFMSLKAMKVTVLLGTILGFIFCIIATYKWPNAAYYLLPTRAWEMMIGGVAYLYPFALQDKSKKIAEWSGFILIIGSYFLISKDNPWPGYLAIIPVLGTFLIIQSQCNESLITSNVVFQKLGTWSYSIYLWHWPMVVAIYYFSLSENYIYLGIVLSILLGFLSNKYIEKIKFRNDFGHIFSYLKCKPIYMTLIVGLLSSYIYLDKGENYWINLQDPVTQKTYSLLSERRPAMTNNWGADIEGHQDFSDCRFNVQNLTEEIEFRLKKCESSYGPGVLILGDSHAQDLFGMASFRFDGDFIVGITNSQGCRPHTPYIPNNPCQYENVKQFLSKNNHIFTHIIYEQGGFYLLLDENGNKGSRTMFSKLSLLKKVEGIQIDEDHVELVINYLAEISEFAPITWFGSRIEHHFTNEQILQQGCDANFNLRDGQKTVFNSLDRYINTHTTSLKKVKFLSQNEVLDYQFPRDFMNCEKILWADGDHISIVGEEVFGKRLPDSFLEF